MYKTHEAQNHHTHLYSLPWRLSAQQDITVLPGLPRTQPTPQAPQTAAVTKCDVNQTVEAPATLNNTSETQILMPVDGAMSDSVLAQAGDRVSAGQVLAQLDDKSKGKRIDRLERCADRLSEGLRLSQIIEREDLARERSHSSPSVAQFYPGRPLVSRLCGPGHDHRGRQRSGVEEGTARPGSVYARQHGAQRRRSTGLSIEVDAVANQPFHKE